MGWIWVSDDFYDHPKFVEVGALGIAFWITGMGYCNRNLTDGLIPKQVASRLADIDGIMLDGGGSDLCGVVINEESEVASQTVSLLLWQGLWHEDGHECSRCVQPGPRKYVVHDYLIYQRSREEALDLKEKRSNAGKTGAAARWGKPGAKSDRMANRMANEWQNDAPTPTPTTHLEKDQSQNLSSRKRAATGSRIPDDFRVTPEMVAWAAANCPDVDGKYATEQFVDYWSSESGAKATKLDWTRTWQTWMRREQKQAPRKRGNGYVSPTDANIAAFLNMNGQPRAIGDGA